MQAVFTSSETLHELQSETIEAAFGCKPFDFCGHAERTIFAAKCELHDRKYLVEEYGFTEVLDSDGNPVSDGNLRVSGWNEPAQHRPTSHTGTVLKTSRRSVLGLCACGSYVEAHRKHYYKG
jgi:hypothetical protein